jgi:hypothetical protein
MVYPGSGQFGPYVQQLMILMLKSTQNLGGSQQSVKEEEVLVGGLLGANPMVWPRHRWSLPLVGEEGDIMMAEELLVSLGGLPRSRCRAEANGMESSD